MSRWSKENGLALIFVLSLSALTLAIILATAPPNSTGIAQGNIGLEILKLLPTIVLGLMAAGIAYRQWRTAQDKFVLDLFDRRMRVFEKTWYASRTVLREGRESRQVLLDLTEAQLHSTFLFGPEVSHLISAIRDCVIEVGGSDPSALPDLHSIKKLMKLSEELGPLCEPYMKMDHRPKRV